MKKTKKEVLITTGIIFVFWTLISLPNDVFTKIGLINLLQHIILGMFLSLFIALIIPHPIMTEEEIVTHNPRTVLRLLHYLMVLIIDIFLAGIDVARRALRPNILISPGIVEFQTPLKKPITILLNATSITLTPGTITIDVKETDKGAIFTVHCISKEAMEDIKKTKGFLERIIHIYGDNI